jgi:hypothetical protein
VPCNDEYGESALALEDSALAAVSQPVRALARIRSVRTCAAWTARDGDPELPTPTGIRKPVHIVVREYDTSGAPPEAARRIASLLGNATVVELPAQGHNDAPRPGSCAMRIIFAFAGDPTRPVDTSCIAGMPRIQFVTEW